MALEALKTCRLIKSEDLNHHGTLFAGRCAEWFVESGFIAVAAKLDPRTVVCLKIHGMEFLHPVTLGSVLTFESRIVATGRSTIVVYVKSFESKTPDRIYSDGFITFCHVDEHTHACPHGLSASPETLEEIELNLAAKELLARRKKA